jgi:ribosomal protein S25
MDDRKQRIDKLSERFKERSGRPKLSAKDRARRSFYLDNEIVERLDKDYKKFNHQAYPHTVSKSVFMETILEYGLNNLPSIKELIKEKSDTEPQED